MSVSLQERGRAAREERIRVGGDEISFRLTSEESDGALAAFDVRMPAGGGPPVLHRHEAFELYRVEQGELAFYLAEDGETVRRTVAGPGGVIAIPGDREHTIRNESDDEAHAYVVFSPGAEIEAFVREAGELGTAGTPEVEGIMALAEAHGIEITRPLEGIALAAGPSPELRREPVLEPFAGRWATLLETRKRDGSWIGTPVNLVVDGDRAYFGTPATTAKVRRLRNFEDVRITPSTIRGKARGEGVAAHSRLLAGEEAAQAARLLKGKYGFVRGVMVPIEMRIRRTRELFYELSL